VSVLWQGGVSLAAVASVGALVTGAWLFAIPAKPHKPPRVRFALPWLGLGALTALQVLPLPRGLVAWLHPRAVEIIDAGHRAMGLALPDFMPIALAPSDAALQAALFLIAGVAGAVGSVVLMGSGGRESVERLSTGILGLGLLSSLCWVSAHDPELTELLGPTLSAGLGKIAFVNPNHQAGLANIALALLLGRTVRAPTLGLQMVYGILAMGLGVMILVIASRGGIVVLGVILALTALMLPQPAPGTRRDPREEWLQQRQTLAAGGLVVLLLATLVALPILEREFSQSPELHAEPKIQSIMHLPDLVAGSFVLGMAPGSLPVVAGQNPEFGPVRFEFAENLFVQRIVDQGVFFGPLFLIALLWIGWHMVRRRQGVPEAPALLIAVIAFLMSNLVDFSSEIAGGLLVAVALATSLERMLPYPGQMPSRPDRAKHRLHRRLLATGGLGLATAAAMLLVARQGLTRAAPDRLQGLKPAVMAQEIGHHYAHHHHAFYLLARAALLEGDHKTARAALNRAVALRPDSRHARLFRLALFLGVGQPQAAVADMVWLLDHGLGVPNDPTLRALTLCSNYKGGDEVLLQAVLQRPEKSLSVGQFLQNQRPALVETIALALRKKYPQRRFGIEVVRGRIYVKRGNLEPARQIAAQLLADASTRLDGYSLEGTIQGHTGKPDLAYHMFREVCEQTPDDVESCMFAVQAILAANKPQDAMDFLVTVQGRMNGGPENAAFYWASMARAQLQLGRNADALVSAGLAQGLAREKNNDVSVLLAECNLEMSQVRDARDLIDAVLRRAPAHPGALLLRAKIEQSAGPLKP
jgi:tetratricopeptide (TPR) repeat protein